MWEALSGETLPGELSEEASAARERAHCIVAEALWREKHRKFVEGGGAGWSGCGWDFTLADRLVVQAMVEARARGAAWRRSELR